MVFTASQTARHYGRRIANGADGSGEHAFVLTEGPIGRCRPRTALRPPGHSRTSRLPGRPRVRARVRSRGTASPARWRELRRALRCHDRELRRPLRRISLCLIFHVITVDSPMDISISLLM
jgi:hypothetical protein